MAFTWHWCLTVGDGKVSKVLPVLRLPLSSSQMMRNSTGRHVPASGKAECKWKQQCLHLYNTRTCNQRLEENAPRGELFCCNDVIKEIYFYTTMSLSPFLKCKCNHVTSLLRILQRLPVFYYSGFQIKFFSPSTRTIYPTKYKPLRRPREVVLSPAYLSSPRRKFSQLPLEITRALWGSHRASMIPRVEQALHKVRLGVREPKWVGLCNLLSLPIQEKGTVSAFGGHVGTAESFLDLLWSTAVRQVEAPWTWGMCWRWRMADKCIYHAGRGKCSEEKCSRVRDKKGLGRLWTWQSLLKIYWEEGNMIML